MMESIGTILREAREAKDYSIEQVARDTNIARKYIESLEREDTSIFPGETYFIGFLRNYADFLGLNPEELIGAFKNLQIQEQPPPMEKLLVRPRSPLVPLLLILTAVALLAGAGWFFFGEKILSSSSRFLNPTAEAPEPQDEETLVSRETYQFRDETLERGFSRGDVILVKLASQEYSLIIKSTTPPVEIGQGDKTEQLSLGESTIFDVSGDGQGDLKIFLRQILEDEGRVVLYLDRHIESEIPVEETAEGSYGEESMANEASQEERTLATADLGSTSDPDRRIKEAILLETDRAEPFRLDVVFRGLCLLRYVKDNELREERYFHKGEVFKLEVQRELRLWISNAGSFKGKIQGVDLSVGNPGEVATRLIRWESHDRGRYQLKLKAMY